MTHLDKVGHGKVHDIMLPGELEDDVGMQEVVALEQTGREAVEGPVLQEICQKVFGNLYKFSF